MIPAMIFWPVRASLARSQASKASANGRLLPHEATFLAAAAADVHINVQGLKPDGIRFDVLNF